MHENMKSLLEKIASGGILTVDESELAFSNIMSDQASPVQIAAFLMALRIRGETVDEITGAVKCMRQKMLTIQAPSDAIDIVGTGGDAKGTHNISTCTAFVVAGAGVPVAKHGNRAISSKSGAADVLAALGVNVEADVPTIEKSLKEANICFLWAPKHHSAMRYVMPVRQELATRTIFNILGPLCNPARVRRQFTGSFSRNWIKPMAQTLGNLDSERAWVVHGADGMDELSTTGVSYVAELRDGKVSTFEIEPGEVGIKKASIEELVGGDPDYNANAIKDVLNGNNGPLFNIIIYNAGAAIFVAGKAENLKTGIDMAVNSIESGKASEALNRLIEITNLPP